MKLETASGAIVEFADGKLAAFAFREGGVRVALDEELGDAGSFGAAAQPAASLGLDGDDIAARLLCTAATRQPFAGGERRTQIRQRVSTGIFNGGAADRRGTSFTIRFSFDLPAPVRWTVRLEAPARIEDGGADSVRVAVSESVSLLLRIAEGDARVAGAEPSPAGAALPLDLPPGRSVVELQAELKPWERISDTVVICRPHQMREAAIALAAIPDRRFIPLLVVEPPPMSFSEFGELLRPYHEHVGKVVERQGAFGLAELEDATPEEQVQRILDFRNMRPQQLRLHPYRSWLQRNLMIRYALADFGIAKAVCLSELDREDLLLPDAQMDLVGEAPVGEDAPAATGLLDGIDRIVLRSACASEPAAAAGDMLDRLLDECIEVFALEPTGFELADRGDVADVIAGLFRARRRNCPLKLVESRGVRRPAALVADEARGDHVIGVECRDDAQSLVASLYAAELDTALVVLPEPERGAVDRLIGELQDAVAAQSRLSGTPDQPPATAAPAGPDRRWPASLTAFWQRTVLGDRRPELLSRLEKAVTNAVDPAFVAAVGDRALTIFGSGTPYGFVRTERGDWGEKRIGHIISDADLIVINEFYSRGTFRPPISFSVIIDPGFFDNSETEVVAEQLAKTSAKTLLLRNEPQLARWFFLAVHSLPLDFVFFNTHGTDESIMLGIYPLQNFQITQWLQFDERPFIFNNSCQSWIGVGRDFIRVGARAYVGTLWSVGSDAAADLARHAVTRIVEHGEPGSGAIRGSGVDPFTSRAYIFVGTADASLARHGGASADRGSLAAVSLLHNYLNLLKRVRVQMTPSPTNFAAQLYGEFKTLRDEMVAARDPQVAPVLADLILGELRMLEETTDHMAATPEYRWELAGLCEAILAEPALQEGQEEKTRGRRLAALQLRRAELHLLAGDFALADAEAKASYEKYRAIGLSGASARQVRIQIAIDERRLGDAFELATEARAEHESDRDKTILLATLGRLCQVLKRDPERTEEAIEIAQRGLEMATVARVKREEATFALDLAQLHLINRDPEAALEPARRALAAGRRSESDSAISELAAYGTLGQCYLALGRLKEARSHSFRGLARARSLNERRRAAAFLADLGQIEEAEGNFEKAAIFWRAAFEGNAALNQAELWQASVSVVTGRFVQRGENRLAASLFCAAIGSLASMRESILVSCGGALFALTVRIFSTCPGDARRALFANIAEHREETLAAFGDRLKARSTAMLVFATCETFRLTAAGRPAEALQLAQQVDRATGAGGAFLQMIAAENQGPG